MAIVLMIIGVILGAVVKGQDLISNSKSKNVAATANNWKALIMAYLDRNGRYPGDTARSGQIGGTTSAPTTSDALFQLFSTMTQTPTNPVSAGGQQYWFYLASDAATGGKNVMVICNSAACNTAFTNDDVEIMKAVDTAIDGSADAGAGNFRAIPSATVFTSAPTGSVIFHGTSTKVVGTSTGLLVTRANVANTAGTAWGATSYAAVYYFDKSF